MFSIQVPRVLPGAAGELDAGTRAALSGWVFAASKPRGLAESVNVSATRADVGVRLGCVNALRLGHIDGSTVVRS